MRALEESLIQQNSCRGDIRNTIMLSNITQNEFRFFEKMDLLNDCKKEYQIFELCIFCNRILTEPKEPFKYKRFTIMELRACCFCLKKYKGKSLNELPPHIRINLRRKLKKYLDIK